MGSVFIGRRRPVTVLVRSQRGAALYVALIMLILLALIGIVGMQVAGMQERMSANYYAANTAFQITEGTVRSTECRIEVMLFPDRAAELDCAAFNESVDERCDHGFNVNGWLSDQEMDEAPAVNVRQIDKCIVGESPIAMGTGPEGDVAPISIYQITVYDVDSELNRTSAAAIDTVFKL